VTALRALPIALLAINVGHAAIVVAIHGTSRVVFNDMR
jgi:hypothetical protein